MEADIRRETVELKTIQTMETTMIVKDAAMAIMCVTKGLNCRNTLTHMEGYRTYTHILNFMVVVIPVVHTVFLVQELKMTKFWVVLTLSRKRNDTVLWLTLNVWMRGNCV